MTKQQRHEYYLKNKTRILAKNNAWNHAHKNAWKTFPSNEKTRKQARDLLWRKSHPFQKRLLDVAYYHKNIWAIRQHNKSYYRANKAKIATRCHEYYLTHKAEISARQKARRAAIKFKHRNRY